MFKTNSISLIICIGHLFVEEDASGSDNLGGDCVINNGDKWCERLGGSGCFCCWY